MVVKKNKALTAAPEPEDKALVAATPAAGALVDFWPHPITSDGRRQSVAVVPEAGASLAEVLRQGGMALSGGPVEARVDGAPVARDKWARRLVLPGQIVEARAVVQGGGDSDPFEIITAITVLTLSLYLGPAGWSLGKAALVAGAKVIGGLVVNALFPVELPDAGEPGRAVFSLHGGSNQARPYEPAMLVLGEHRVFPDLAAQEYTQFIGDDQYLFQLFDFGVGDLDIPDSEVKIGDTLLSSFDQVTQELKLPGQAVTLLAGDVQTIAGAELPPHTDWDGNYDSGSGRTNTTGDWVERTSGEKAEKLELDVVGLFFGRKKNGEPETRSVDIQIQRKQHGTSWPASPTTTTVTLSNSAAAPVRQTVEIALTDKTKKWDIRARRKATLKDGRFVKRTTDQGVSWSALRTFQANTADATGRTRLALRIKASGQLQGRIERLSALVKQKVPTWNGTAWSTTNQISSNPADIFRWFVKGVRANGRLVAGVGLPDSRIDETSIRAWRTWCDTEGLKCDAVLTGSQSIADVINMICRCGRASASWASGKLGVVFDQAGLAPTAMITPGNIIAGTLEVNYADGRLADEIVVRYLDPDFDWQPAELRRLKAGVTAPSRTATVTLTGIVNREQAKEETNLIAARQKYHRRRITWEMGPEGLTIGRGDVVQATSDLLSGGTTGRLQPGGTAASPVLNQAVDIKDGVNYMVLRLIDGTLHTTVAQHPDGATATGDTTRPVLQTPLPGLPDHGGVAVATVQPESVVIGGPAAGPAEAGATAGDVLWRHYGATDPPRKLKIIEIEPRAMDRYRFTAIDEVAEYYTAADLELTDPLPDLRYRGPRVIACALSEKQIKVADGFANEITATLTVAGDWRGGVIRARRTTTPEDGSLVEPWRVVAVLDESQTSASWIDQPFGSLEIVVVPGSLVAPAGPAHHCGPYAILGDQDPPDATAAGDLTLVGAQGGWTALWPLPTEPDYALTEVRDAAQTVSNGDLATLRATIKGSIASRVDAATLETPTALRVFIRHLDNSGNASAWTHGDVTTLALAQDGQDGRDGTDGATGAAGAAGPGVQFIYRLTTTRITPTLPTQDAHPPAGWTTTPQGTTATHPYEWVSQRTGSAGSWSDWSAPVEYARHSTARRGAATYYKLDYDGTTWSDTAANEATTGENVLTDVVVLSNINRRPTPTTKFWEMRTWTGTAWLKIDYHIPGSVLFDGSVTARQMFVQNLAALNIKVRDIDIEGTIAANHLVADVFNVKELWAGTSTWNGRSRLGEVVNSHRLTASLTDWDWLLIIGQAGTWYSVAATPGRGLSVGTSATSIATSRNFPKGHIGTGRNDSTTFTFHIWRSSDNERIFMRGENRDESGSIYRIFGIKGPGASSGGGTGGGTTPPPAPTVTTPGVPTSVAVSSPSAGKLRVAWAPPTSDGGAAVSGYDVQYRQQLAGRTTSWGTGMGTTRKLKTDRSHEWTVTGGQTYQVRVQARNSAGPGDWSAWSSSQTVTAPPPAKLILTLTSGRDTTYNGIGYRHMNPRVGSLRRTGGTEATHDIQHLEYSATEAAAGRAPISLWFGTAPGSRYTEIQIGTARYSFTARGADRPSSGGRNYRWHAATGVTNGGIPAVGQSTTVTLR